MPQKKDTMPLTGPPPAEVPLPRAPLALVVAQVRFPTLLAVRNSNELASFQEVIRHRYPYLEREDRALVGAGVPATLEGGGDVHWRFWDETRRWRATLTQNFVALEVLSYPNRDEFICRVEEIVRAFSAAFKPTHTNRLGVRYVDQIKPPSLSRIEKLIRPEILGVFGRTAGSHPEHMITQLSVNAEPGRLLGRWGLLPRGVSPDPFVTSSEENSWVIDLDVSVAADAKFSQRDLVGNARGCAERIYSVFRWMVTKDFLIEYGGNPE